MRAVATLALLAVGAVVTAASAVGAEPQAAEIRAPGAAAVAAPVPEPVQARQADDLVDAFGVQTHLAYPGTP